MSHDLQVRMKKWEERVTQTPKMIDTDHAYVHEGIAFDAWDVATVNGRRVYGLQTPPEKYLHFRPAHLSIAGNMARFRLYQCATGSAAPISGGSTFAPVNRNHVSSTISEVVFRVGAVTSSTGDYLEKYSTKVFGGSGPGQSRTGVSKGEPLEWVLRPGRQYAITVNTTVNTEYGLNLFWYEEDSA